MLLLPAKKIYMLLLLPPIKTNAQVFLFKIYSIFLIGVACQSVMILVSSYACQQTCFRLDVISSSYLFLFFFCQKVLDFFTKSPYRMHHFISWEKRNKKIMHTLRHVKCAKYLENSIILVSWSKRFQVVWWANKLSSSRSAVKYKLLRSYCCASPNESKPVLLHLWQWDGSKGRPLVYRLLIPKTPHASSSSELSCCRGPSIQHGLALLGPVLRSCVPSSLLRVFGEQTTHPSVICIVYTPNSSYRVHHPYLNRGEREVVGVSPCEPTNRNRMTNNSDDQSVCTK